MAYSAAVLADSPLVYFRPNKAGGACTWSQGSLGAGMCASTATALPGYSGAVSDGGSLVAQTQFQSLFGGAISKPYSFECWAWSTHVGSSATTGDFLTANPDSSVSNLFGFQWFGDSRWASVQPSSGSAVTATRVPFTWTHLVVTVDGTTLTFYVNGTSAGTTADHTALNTFGTQIITQISGTSSGVFVAEIAFYHSLLSSSRVAAHHSAAVLMGPPTVANGLTAC